MEIARHVTFTSAIGRRFDIHWYYLRKFLTRFEDWNKTEFGTCSPYPISILPPENVIIYHASHVIANLGANTRRDETGQHHVWHFKNRHIHKKSRPSNFRHFSFWILVFELMGPRFFQSVFVCLATRRTLL